jgi:shikimate dehydrogenase
MIVDNIVGLIGWPVSHSISPAMQNRAFLECGLLNWIYVPMPVSRYPYIRVKEAVLGLRALGFRGANVTVPYKEAVLPYLERLSDTAKVMQAVNTIVVDDEGRLVGHNTDGIGFIADLRAHNLDVRDMRALILGGGGSARAVVYALLSHGCKSILILNRTKTKADDIAATLRDAFNGATIDTGPLDRDLIKQMPYCDLVVNATSIGMAATLSEMPWDENVRFVAGQVVYDLIYNPKETTLLGHAVRYGATAINGLGMLVHQGAAAFELWTGLSAPVIAMYEAARAALK